MLLDNAERLDKLVNGPAADVPDRGGEPLYSWRQMMAKNAEAINALMENGGVAVYTNESVLRASVPTEQHNLAVDQSTGNYYSWDKTVVAPQQETTALLARMTTQPTEIQKAAINRLYYDLKQAGILAKLDGLWLGINTSRADARLNIVNSSLPLTENGTIEFNKSSGWAFSGSSWLDTGFNPSTAGGHYSKDSASFGVMVAGASNSGVFMGAYDGANGLTLSRTGNTLNARINNNELLTGQISLSGTTLFSASRLNAETSTLYSGSKVVDASDSSSLPLINASVNIGRAMASDDWYTSSIICAAFIASGLTETEMFAMNDAVQRYIAGFRAAALPAGVWVQTPYSLIKPADVTAISTDIVDRKTALLANAIVSCDTYSDIMELSVTSPDVRVVDESTGVVYEPSVIPDTTLSETTALVERMGVKPGTIQQLAINQLIYILKDAGIWSALDGLWLGVSTSYDDSLLNIVKDEYNLTTNDPPAWNQSGGWTFSRTGLTYLDTGYNPAIVSGKLALEDASFGALLFPKAGVRATGHIMGAFNGTNGMSLSPRPTEAASSPMAVRLNQDKAYIPGDYPIANAVYGVSRLNGELAVYREGLLLGSTTQAATALTNSNVLLGCSQKTTGYHMFDGAIGAAWVGASLTAKQMLTLTHAIRRYNDIFRSRMSPDATWWSPTDRRMYSQEDIIAIAGSKAGGSSGSSALEPSASEATVSANISLTLSKQGQ
ncbi:TPA: hypothetical protein L9L06_002438, partial [Klebsiella pneumoniae]|nr:hypothetical protein [Klebsiella pneumoniae]